MSYSFWMGRKRGRQIVQRIIVEGDLVLQSPARFGAGDTDDLTDMPLLVDPLEGTIPLLTGATIAGALRSYLRAREMGYRRRLSPEEETNTAAARLFGGVRGDDEGEQSSLIVNDSLGWNHAIEIRDGVAIDPESRTAGHDALFDMQVWHAGTTFPLRFELLISDGDDTSHDVPYQLRQALASALLGLTDRSITLGARKQRGFGRVSVDQWYVKVFDLTYADGLMQWILHGAQPLARDKPAADICEALDVDAIEDRREVFRMTATLVPDASVMIRAGSGEDDIGPDMIHLRSRQVGGDVEPILAGTSLSGALRARARKIVKTLNPTADAFVDEMFGTTERASRVIVEEHVIENTVADLVQSRVSIDRFSGGALEAALFAEQPAFSDQETQVTIDLQLINPHNDEIGLLLLLLKDLWTSDLPIGGESSIGRGRLSGKRATLELIPEARWWEIVQDDGRRLRIAGGTNEDLEMFVSALNATLTGADNENH